MKVSVILPCYNEEAIIGKTLNEISSFAKKNKSYEFIFVDDGSRDNTVELIKKQVSKNIRLISYRKNKGKGFAIQKGVEKAMGDWIFFLDSDLAYPVDYVNEMKKVGKTDIVIGSRALVSEENIDKVSLTRLITGKGYNALLRLLLNIPFKDTQAGIKGFKKEVAKMLFAKKKKNNFSFDVEVLFLARKKGFSIAEFPVTVSEGHKNQPSQVKVIRDSLSMFKDLLEIRVNSLLKKYE